MSKCVKELYKTDMEALNDCELATILLYATDAGLSDLNGSAKVLLNNNERRLRIPLMSAISRDEGLISLTEEGIFSSNHWSEGDAFINIRSGDVEYNVLGIYTMDETDELLGETEMETLDDSVNLQKFNLKDIKKISETITKLPLKTCSGEIIVSYE